MSDPIIRIEGLRKAYASGTEALKGVDLDIQKGEILALLGPNGAGKTTLINIVCGIVTATGGQVLVAGTGNEKALYQNGGIFTQALIDGLKGGSDWNRDGLVQFPELALFVRNSVISKARQTGFEQKPSFYTISGDGQFLFILQR